MEKIYTVKPTKNQNALPKKQTIDFILNYSKAYSQYDCKGLKVEMLMN